MTDFLLRVLIFGSVYSIVMGICWYYARRKLTDRELSVWRWRSEHPTICWLRFLIMSYFLTCVVVIGLMTVMELFIAQAARTAPFVRQFFSSIEPAVAMFFISSSVGSIVFGFWYWNGIALYQRRLLEAAAAAGFRQEQSNAES
jgi:hypothetical protein